MGLPVDIPKAGFGNTNDGNTARRFFSNPETSSRITGIDINVIKKCSVILETLSSGLKIDTQKFENFAEQTAKLYVDLYEWHPMSPTMHKILRHGATVIDHLFCLLASCRKRRLRPETNTSACIGRIFPESFRAKTVTKMC